jgi:SAM-dependent methyltransferase
MRATRAIAVEYGQRPGARRQIEGTLRKTMGTEHPPICDYEGSDYQQRFWDAGERQYEHRVEQIALARLLPKSGDRLLELGAGAGRNTPRYGGFRKIALLDYSMTQLRQAQDRLGKDARFLYVAADVYRLPFAPGAFDAATMIRTLHHMAAPEEALRQVRGALSTGGTFILEYANKRNLKAILRWLLRRQDWNPFDQEPIEFAELNFNFHPKAVRTWLQAVGFKLERQLTVSHFRVGLLKRLIPTGLLVGMDSLSQWTGNWWQYTPSVFARASAVGEQPPSRGDAFWRCPACASIELIPSDDGLRCTGCSRIWPIVDGIYDFKVPS